MSRANEPAFPSTGWIAPYDPNGNAAPVAPAGMTIREEFASRIMAGFCGDPTFTGNVDPQIIADSAVVFADALIARLAQP